VSGPTTARAAGLVGCHVCGLVVPAPAGGHGRCPRCRASLHSRKTDSLARSWACLVAAMICYVPANILPVMKTTSLGYTQVDTIMSGVLYLLTHGQWPLAAIVFTASIAVPMAKIIMLGFLLVSVQRRSRWRPADRAKIYRIVEFIGRWSMVDVYVVTVLAALVYMGSLARITPQPGVVFFGAVVILTMFAAMAFDPRLMWDVMEKPGDE
jgi:paraquat-inducible protein A